MASAQLEQQFVSRVRELLVMLPYDLKVLFEAMSDEDLSGEARLLATGGVVYCLSPVDPIPDHTGLVGFVDDAVIVRLVLHKLVKIGGEAISGYPERFTEQFESLEQDIQLIRDYLGEAIEWVDNRIENLSATKYKGKDVQTYVEDDEWSQRLYEYGLEFTTEYEIDDDAAAKLTSGKPILDAFSKRNELERSRRKS